MRPLLIAGNWKMNTDGHRAAELARQVADGLPESMPDTVEVLVCPPMIWLEAVAEFIDDSPVMLGAQTVHFEPNGAFTGEISAEMLASVGCTHVIIGHSERRQFFGETDDTVSRRVKRALEAGLVPIVCVGETLGEREQSQTERVVETQLGGGLAGLSADQVGQLVIAYEPVWAIGTGRTATPEMAQAVHGFIRAWLGRQHGAPVADAVQILYGGSMKPDNAAELLRQPDIDGGLIGGASLKADDFLAIVQAALALR